MSIASEIQRIQGAKADIKTAIENKGVTVDSTKKISEYADLIDTIKTNIDFKLTEQKSTPTQNQVLHTTTFTDLPCTKALLICYFTGQQGGYVSVSSVTGANRTLLVGSDSRSGNTNVNVSYLTDITNKLIIKTYHNHNNVNQSVKLNIYALD